MKTILKTGITVLLGLFCLTLAQADDQFPAPYRGAADTVEAHWTTITNQFFPGVPQPPDTFNYIGPDPLYAGPPFNQFPQGFIVFPDPGTMEIYLPNVIDDLPLKEMRVQIYYDPQTPPPPPLFLGGSAEEGGAPIPGPTTAFESIAGPGFSVWDFTWEPNPDWETVVFDVNGLDIRQVDIDTVSVPEPSTLALLAGAASLLLVMIHRRRG